MICKINNFVHSTISENPEFCTLTPACYSPYCSLHISLHAGKENLFNNQELLQLVIISFILMTLMFVLGVILIGENSYLSLLGVKVLTSFITCMRFSSKVVVIVLSCFIVVIFLHPTLLNPFPTLTVLISADGCLEW